MAIEDTSGLHYLRIKPAKVEELGKEAQLSLLSAFLHLGKRSVWERLLRNPHKRVSFEIYSINQQIFFYVVTPSEWGTYFASQIASHYPRVVIEQTTDPVLSFTSLLVLAGGALHQAKAYAFSLNTTHDVTEKTLIASILGVLSKAQPGTAAGVAMVLRIPEQGHYERAVRRLLHTKNSEGVEERSIYAPQFEQKLKFPFVEAQIRVLAGSVEDGDVSGTLGEIMGAYGVYTKAEGNGLIHSRVKPKQIPKHLLLMEQRTFGWGAQTLVLNTAEAASLWYLPDKSLEYLRAIDWGATYLSEPPDNLPVSELVADNEQKRSINFFAQTDWKNHQAIFGIQNDERRRHMYFIGKTGSGKSTLIANMAINDIRNGHGVAVIDPHGDLTEMILEYIPKRRVNDVVYLDPTISDSRSFSLNLFDKEGAEHTDVVASGIISVFYKLYYHSWGPRLEYILRNAILTLLYYEKATFADIILLLTKKSYRQQVVEAVADKDPVIANFWNEEFERMNEKLRVEAISPILNKVGQFLSSQRIRHIVGNTKSTFSLREVMDNGKILVLNLSQGKLGEDTTALLGAMFITKMQLTAMQRVHMPEDQRKDFYLYVDEFQNFATQSFIKILSEARKYRLNLIMANQYIGQVDEEIQKAIFGNVGTLLTFVVGARDANLLAREFGNAFSEEELVGLGKFEVLLKMAIDGLTSKPFFAQTLPLPSTRNENREKIVKVSLEKHYKAID